MLVKRLDLGADVIYLPQRDLLVLHPDLDYAESLGAVAGTLPHLHSDVVVGLVEQVTPRPRHRCLARRAVVPAIRMTLASLVTLLVMTQWFGAPAPAVASFGETWNEVAAGYGLDCKADGSRVRTCLDTDGNVTRVQGFRHPDASLYMLTRIGQKPTFVLIFDNLRAAQAYDARHPGRIVVGRVATW